jgi:predicted DNA-binding protein YlxM (UPF0122 family)
MENKYAISVDYDLAVKRVEESVFSAEDKENYLSFINNFQNLNFYYNTDLSMAEPATKDNIYFPKNFSDYRKTLADILYGFNVEIKFDSFNGYSPRGKRLENIWYSIDPGDFSFNDDQKKVLLESSESFRLLPIGFTSSNDAQGCYLAINLSNNDNSIYEFHMQDLYDNYSSGEPIDEMTSVVFDSYPQMLAHISEIKYLDGKKEIIVKARET